MRQVGIVVVSCDSEGKLQTPTQTDWLVDLLLASPLLQRAIDSDCEKWLSQDSIEVSEAFAGLWISPVRQHQSRRSGGFTIGLIVSDELCDGEYFHALCQASDADATVIRKLIQSTTPVTSKEVQRMASLFQLAWGSTMQCDSGKITIDSIGQELADSYEEISLLYTMTSSMNSVNHPERFIELACNELLQTLPYEWVGVKLNIGKRLPNPGNTIIHASNNSLATSELDVQVLKVLETAQQGVTVIANGKDAVSTQFGPATIIEPIINDGVVIGVLIAANKQGVDCSASSVDIKLLAATATQLGIFIENAMLYEDLNATFLGTLEALTTSIDAKDKYTCGHSQRVALLTAQLAKAHGLNEDQVDRFRIAGLVHDIGKIGVPEDVLTKNGGLTEQEYLAVQKHPEIGARILRDIPQMEDILGGVLHHHEKYAGGGYPHGISGERIPLVARMISLADTFDAMSSCRTYRNALTRQSVLDEMKRVSGTQFDPSLAELFFDLDFSEWERMMIDHQSGNALHSGARETTFNLKDAA
jgi:HD-GYP domain-containing protein (c-di-GMP phosphodiesterase class II)